MNNNTDKNILRLREVIRKTKASNKSPLYNNMLYWSQKPYTITDVIIDTLSNKEDIILDPFMGSGVSLIQSLHRSRSRKSVGVEINDTPIFLCKNSLNSVTPKQLSKLDMLKSKIHQLESIYHTNCPICNNKTAVIKKIIYDIKPKVQITDIAYNCSCNKKILHKPADDHDIVEFNRIHKINNIENKILLENSRIAVKFGDKISDKFTNRSLFVLDNIKNLINEENDEKTKRIFNYIYISIIHKSKILDVKMSSQWPLWVPKKNCLERNVVLLFEDAIDRYKKSLEFIDTNYHLDPFVDSFQELKNGKSMIIQNGAQLIQDDAIPTESIDLVITDPPYLGQVPYSEYMQLYQSFLDNVIDYSNEIVITNAVNRTKDYDEYMDLMELAFKNVARMMKQGSLMCMYFHDSKLEVWNDLIELFDRSGLVFKTCIHINKTQKTLKKILDPKKTMNGESLIVFKKAGFVTRNRNEFETSAIIQIRDICLKLLHKNDSKQISTSELYDGGVLEYIIENGLLDSVSKKYKDLTEVFDLFMDLDPDTGQWKRTIDKQFS